MVILAVVTMSMAARIPARAQAPIAQTLSGVVVNDGRPVSSEVVTLHRVTPSVSGPVGEATTGPDGRFRIPLPPPDTSRFTVYFTTVEHQTVRYFGPPIHPGQVSAGYTVEVFDTTSAARGSVRIARRDLILVPETESGWTVNEVVRVMNTGRRTLVPARDMPTAEFAIPERATEVELGEGDVASTELSVMDQRVLIRGPLLPGPRELILRYRIPAEHDETSLTLDLPTDTLNVFVRQPSPELRVTGLASTRTVTFGAESFVQYGSTALAPGAALALEWQRSGPPVNPVIAGVVVTLLVLSVGTVAAYRNRGALRPSPPRPTSAAAGSAR